MTFEHSLKLDCHIKHICDFLEPFRDIINAYLSDFFVLQHERTISVNWWETLCKLEPPELASLLNNQTWNSSVVWPLSLLAFRASLHALSIPRIPTGKVCIRDSLGHDTGHLLLHQVAAEDDDNCAAIEHGQHLLLEHCYRRHVKPKKQHEILQLSKVIRNVSEACKCRHVVDVGAGQGHLSRLLSFGYGLKVTTVEASGCHTPKAAKFDREVVKNLQKGVYPQKEKKHPQVKRPSDESERRFEIPTSPPNHVVATIDPSVSVCDFLKTLELRDTCCSDESTGVQDHYHEQPSAGCDIRSRGHCQSESCADSASRDEMSSPQTASRASGHSSGNHGMDNRETRGADHKETRGAEHKETRGAEHKETRGAEHKETRGAHHKETRGADHKETRGAEHKETRGAEYKETRGAEHKETRGAATHNAGTNQVDTRCTNLSAKHDTDTQAADIRDADTQDADIRDADTQDADLRDADTQDADIRDADTQNADLRDADTDVLMGEARGFVLAGLHACGDLTPTMLRVFARCPQAVGLASVGCCYMKMTSPSGGQGAGYPMSELVRSIHNHGLSWEAREMACHFVDCYHDRLKANPPGLMTHAYRAALQEIIHDKAPSMDHGSIKLTFKGTAEMPFQMYAETALTRLKLDPVISPEQLDRVERRLASWRMVVAFYTLRLSLAPVVESLILLDRVQFLQEQGFQTALLPVFDPKLSPRNFVLLSTRQSSPSVCECKAT